MAGVPVLEAEEAGPTALRMLLGTRLRRLREGRGVTREEAAGVIGASPSKISRMELGRHGFKPRNVTDLLDLYGVDDPAEREALLTLVEQAAAPGWWQPYGDVVPPWFEPYLGMEQSAAVIRTYEVQFVPGLLQTPGYARAVIRLGSEDPPPEEVERRVALRMRRARILHRRAGAPRLWAVIDEGALRRAVCDPPTMREQIDHLIEMSRAAHVNVQVLPFSAGGHPAAGGPICILRFAQRELPDMVYLEQLSSARYPANESELTRYRHIMDRLVVQAAPPDETTALLHRIRARL
ncbi:Helix-turn-helix domain-containing protein [Thermomonospora echinospora]|uniref:Helix-turn-helix domain-containing protein n=1 Tax=Thermomonospora echinospora TaxID=1992 RepID=A0A1H6DJR9_9ACTN|nr:helix-turn-helix transcriptional regulator [Thermomonospora echinospora]SEG85657.1 Helix-turn-helix domain-containing protein [Thermomonospora echinospora]